MLSDHSRRPAVCLPVMASGPVLLVPRLAAALESFQPRNWRREARLNTPHSASLAHLVAKPIQKRG